MKLFVKKQEFRTIKTLCSSPIHVDLRYAHLGNLSEEHFHLEPTRTAYHRICKLARSGDDMPSWEELLSDPVLSEDFREVLAEEKPKAYKKLSELEKSRNTLEKYRRIRTVYYTAKESIESLSNDTIDIEQVIENMANGISNAHTQTSDIEEQTLSFGDGDDETLAYIKEQIDAPSLKMLKTGFDEYDETNGGLPSSGVMLMASTTSGGKSVTSMNLALNLYMLNCVSVNRVSLEMIKAQEYNRLCSRITGIPMAKISQRKLTPKQKKLIVKRMTDFVKNPHFKDPHVGRRKFKEKKRFSTMTPETGLSVDQMFSMLKPHGFDVNIVDYVGLLDGMDGERQWQNLSGACAVAKAFSRQTKSLVIILCQLDDETDKLRYSKGMKDHADVLWIWNYANQEVRDTKQLPINAAKVRDGELMGFLLDEMFEKMLVTNPKGNGGFGRSLDDDESVTEGSGVVS